LGNRKLSSDEIFNELKWFSTIFSKLPNYEKRYLKDLIDILELTKGKFEIFLLDFIFHSPRDLPDCL